MPLCQTPLKRLLKYKRHTPYLGREANTRRASCLLDKKVFFFFWVFCKNFRVVTSTWHHNTDIGIAWEPGVLDPPFKVTSDSDIQRSCAGCESTSDQSPQVIQSKTNQYEWDGCFFGSLRLLRSPVRIYICMFYLAQWILKTNEFIQPSQWNTELRPGQIHNSNLLLYQ